MRLVERGGGSPSWKRFELSWSHPMPNFLPFSIGAGSRWIRFSDLRRPNYVRSLGGESPVKPGPSLEFEH
jgi:hypothetical protein